MRTRSRSAPIAGDASVCWLGRLSQRGPRTQSHSRQPTRRWSRRPHRRRTGAGRRQQVRRTSATIVAHTCGTHRNNLSRIPENCGRNGLRPSRAASRPLISGVHNNCESGRGGTTTASPAEAVQLRVQPTRYNCESSRGGTAASPAEAAQPRVQPRRHNRESSRGGTTASPAVAAQPRVQPRRQNCESSQGGTLRVQSRQYKGD